MYCSKSSHASHMNENFCVYFNVVVKCAFGQPNFTISPTRTQEPFSSYLYSVCDPAGVKLEKIGKTDSPSLIKYLTLSHYFYVHFPKWKSRWHHLSLYSDNLLFKFLLKWKSGDNANSAVTAHSHNGHDGKLVGRELEHPGGINMRHLHCH